MNLVASLGNLNETPEMGKIGLKTTQMMIRPLIAPKGSAKAGGAFLSLFNSVKKK